MSAYSTPLVLSKLVGKLLNTYENRKIVLSQDFPGLIVCDRKIEIFVRGKCET